MKEYMIEDLNLSELVAQLSSGSVMLYPTDTVAGIGSVGSIEKSVNRVFKAKLRSLNKPVSYAFSSVNMIEQYTSVPETAFPLLDLLPGPLTLILPIKPASPKLYGIASKTLGVRIPNVVWLIDTIELLDEPIITTSANPSGTPPSTSYKKIDESLLKCVDIAVKWKGELQSISSTVVLINDGVRILREGSISKSTINKLVG